MTVATAPGSRTSASNENPGEGSAVRASPTGVSGERAKARATPPAAPAAAISKVVLMVRAASWRGETPSALSVA
jgi:hypothetical protein